MLCIITTALHYLCYNTAITLMIFMRITNSVDIKALPEVVFGWLAQPERASAELMQEFAKLKELCEQK